MLNREAQFGQQISWRLIMAEQLIVNRGPTMTVEQAEVSEPVQELISDLLSLAICSPSDLATVTSAEQPTCGNA